MKSSARKIGILLDCIAFAASVGFSASRAAFCMFARTKLLRAKSMTLATTPPMRPPTITFDVLIAMTTSRVLRVGRELHQASTAVSSYGGLWLLATGRWAVGDGWPTVTAPHRFKQRPGQIRGAYFFVGHPALPSYPCSAKRIAPS